MPKQDDFENIYQPPRTPIGAFAHVAGTNGVLAVSGQLPFDTSGLIACGRVGEDVTLVKAQEAARQCVLNALFAVRAEVGQDWRARVEVLRLVVLVACGGDPVDIPAVADAASATLHDYLKGQKLSARTAFGVAQLPANAPVEVELTFIMTETETNAH